MQGSRRQRPSLPLECLTQPFSRETVVASGLSDNIAHASRNAHEGLRHPSTHMSKGVGRHMLFSPSSWPAISQHIPPIRLELSNCTDDLSTFPCRRLEHLALTAVLSMAPPAKQRKTAHEAEKYFCTTCATNRLAKQFPDYNPTPDCEHLINTCSGCLKQWVKSQVEAGAPAVDPNNSDVFGISCPECDGIMRNVNIQIAATKKTYNR